MVAVDYEDRLRELVACEFVARLEVVVRPLSQFMPSLKVPRPTNCLRRADEGDVSLMFTLDSGLALPNSPPGWYNSTSIRMPKLNRPCAAGSIRRAAHVSKTPMI